MGSQARIRYERLASDRLKQLGYYVARSAGSRGAADLIAISTQNILLIQVKTTKAPQSSGFKGIIEAARRELLEVPCPPNVKRQIWIRAIGKTVDRPYCIEKFKRVVDFVVIDVV
ncbi:MAG: hypothetical protein V2G41_09540 [bacterium JZ-2024 1]